MRFGLLVIAFGGTLALAGVAQAEGPEAVAPASQQLVQSGFALLAKGQPVAAVDDFETALAVDPKNRQAYIGLARAARAQSLPGKAVKYYREALQLEPNDLDALQGQGEALATRGAKVAAQANLERIRQLCKTDCAAAKSLAIAIAQAPAQTVATANSPPPAAKN